MTRIVAMPNKCGLVALLAVLVSLLLLGFAQGERNSTASRGCKSHSNATSSSSIVASKAHLHRSRDRRLTTEVWCVAISNASEVNLQAALDWACGPLQGQGQVNCGPINSGGACFDPDTTVHHASYAFNEYFQLSNSTPSACNFSGTASLTYADPSSGTCVFVGSNITVTPNITVIGSPTPAPAPASASAPATVPSTVPSPSSTVPVTAAPAPSYTSPGPTQSVSSTELGFEPNYLFCMSTVVTIMTYFFT